MARSYTFESGEKEYTLRFTMNTVCDIEEAADRTPIQKLCAQDAIGFNTLRLIIQHGLKWKNQGITKQRAGEIIAQYAEEHDGSIDKLARETLLLLAESTGSKIKKEDIDEATDGVDAENEDIKE